MHPSLLFYFFSFFLNGFSSFGCHGGIGSRCLIFFPLATSSSASREIPRCSQAGRHAGLGGYHPSKASRVLTVGVCSQLAVGGTPPMGGASRRHAWTTSMFPSFAYLICFASLHVLSLIVCLFLNIYIFSYIFSFEILTLRIESKETMVLLLFPLLSWKRSC